MLSFLFDSARDAELTFTAHARCSQANDAFTSRLSARLSAVVNEVTGIAALPPPALCECWGLRPLGCRPFVRLTSVLMLCVGANGACR